MSKINFKEHINSKNIISTVITLYLIYSLYLFTYLKLNIVQSIILLLIFIPIFFFICNQCYNIFNKVIINYKKQNVINIGLSFTFAILMYAAFYTRVFAQGMLNLIVISGFICFFGMLCYCLIDLFSRLRLLLKDNKSKPVKILLFMIIPLALYGFLFLGVYPGNMSIDSLVVYDNAMSNHYDNSHLIVYNLFIKLLLCIWSSPAIITIFQITLCSFTFAYTGYRLYRLGLHVVWSYIIVIIITFIPVNVSLVYCLWKDIPYTMCLLLFSMEVLRLLTFKQPHKKWYQFIPIMIISFFVAGFRHNGIYVVIVFLLLVLIYLLIKRYYKYCLRVIVFLVVFLILINGFNASTIHILGDKYEESDFSTTAYFAIPINALVVLYNDRYDSLSPEHQAYLQKFLDFDAIDDHNHSYAKDELWRFHGRSKMIVKHQILHENKKQFITGLIDITKTYPTDIIRSYMRMTSVVWSVPEYGYTSTYYPNIRNNEISQKYNLYNHQYSKVAYRVLDNYLCSSINGSNKIIFWRPALMFLIIVLFIILSKDGRLSLLISLPILLNHLSYLASIEGQCTRYMYGDYSIIFVVIILAILQVNIKNIKSSKLVR